MQDLAQRLGNRGAAFLGEKLDFVKKQIAKIQKPGEGELGADGFEGSFGSSGGEDSPTAPIMITYLLQNVDGEDEENVFCVPDASSASRVTLDKIRRRFPVPGHFWFRFKTAYVADGGGDGDYLWLDPIYPSEPVPTYKGQIVMKVLSVPADVLPPPPPPAPTPISTHPHHLASAEGSPPAVVRRRAHTPGPSRDGAATSPRRTLSSNEQARESVSETPGVIMGGGGERMRHHGVRGGGSENLSAGGAKSHPASPLQPSISPSMEHDDLLDFGAGERDDDNLPASAAGGVPVQQLDRDELVRKRLEAKHQRVAEVYTEHNERRQKEATKLQEKIEAGSELSGQMDKWAKTSDGSYKDIRSLLSTLQDVLWEGHDWKPISLSTLMMSSAEVKKAYRLALILAHPDRHQHASADQQYRAERVFQAINAAWKNKQN